MIDLFPEREVFFTVGPLAVHWYGVMYALAFLAGMWMFPKLQKYRGLHIAGKDLDVLFFLSVLAVIVGGRVGYALFYEPSFLLSPADIVAVWRGGMSSHGGALGFLLALGYFSRKYRTDFWALADVVVIPIGIGLIFGRLGNFINLELYGSVTRLPWGIDIPGVEGPRHPTQVYAMLKNALVSAACYLHLTRARDRTSGRTAGLFILLYGVLRFLNEFLRVPTHDPFTFAELTLTRGQLLTLPLIVCGVVILVLRRSRKAS